MTTFPSILAGATVVAVAVVAAVGVVFDAGDVVLAVADLDGDSTTTLGCVESPAEVAGVAGLAIGSIPGAANGGMPGGGGII